MDWKQYRLRITCAFHFCKLFHLKISTGIVRSAIALVLEDEGFRLNTPRDLVKLAKEITRKLLGFQADQQETNLSATLVD